QRHRVERSPGKCGFRACRTRSTSPLCHPWRKRLAVAILPKETGDGNLSRPPSRRGRNQARLVVASSALLTLISPALPSPSPPPHASGRQEVAVLTVPPSAVPSAAVMCLPSGGSVCGCPCCWP